MPRFYFHLYDDMVTGDEEGKEFPDLAAAEQYAVASARSIAAAKVAEQGRLRLGDWIEIADENGAVVGTVRFREVIEVDG